MSDNSDNQDRDEDLLLRLRGLPREIVPPAGVWAGVAERIGAPARPRRRVRVRRHWPAVVGLAAAASLALVLAIGVMPSPQPVPEVPSGVLQAERIAGEYRQALAEVPLEQVPEELQPALAELDRSAASILDAIHEAPASGFLFDQLQRTYAQRLQLTRQAALGLAAAT